MPTWCMCAIIMMLCVASHIAQTLLLRSVARHAGFVAAVYSMAMGGSFWLEAIFVARRGRNPHASARAMELDGSPSYVFSLAVFDAVTTLTTMWSASRVSGTNQALLSQFVIPLSVLVAASRGCRFGADRIVGAICVVIGVFLVLRGHAGDPTPLVPQLALLGGSGSIVLAGVVVERAAKARTLALDAWIALSQSLLTIVLGIFADATFPEAEFAFPMQSLWRGFDCFASGYRNDSLPASKNSFGVNALVCILFAHSRCNP